MLRIEMPSGLHTVRYEAMATEFSASLGGVDAIYAKQALHEAFKLLDDLESKLSLYQETSDVTRINLARKGEVVTISEECMSCLRLALEASALTGGRFNAFLGRQACEAKGFLPLFLADRIEAFQGGVGDAPIIAIDPASRRVEKLRDGVLLDLGAIGKGFALDRLMESLEDWEIPKILLNSGGSTLLCSVTEGFEPWLGKIGGRELRPISEGAIGSSGLGFQPDHIVEPTSGESRCLWTRSYARAKSAALADAFSTGIMLMEWELIERLRESADDLSLAVEQGAELLISGSF